MQTEMCECANQPPMACSSSFLIPLCSRRALDCQEEEEDFLLSSGEEEDDAVFAPVLLIALGEEDDALAFCCCWAASRLTTGRSVCVRACVFVE